MSWEEPGKPPDLSKQVPGLYLSPDRIYVGSESVAYSVCDHSPPPLPHILNQSPTGNGCPEAQAMSPGFVLNLSAGLSVQDGTFQVRQGPEYHGIESKILSICVPSLDPLPLIWVPSALSPKGHLLPKNYLAYKYLHRWV